MKMKKKKKNSKHRCILSHREDNTLAAVVVALEFIKGEVQRAGNPDLTYEVVKGRLERALEWYVLAPREAATLEAAQKALNHINDASLLGRDISNEEAIEKYLQKILKGYGLTKSDIEWYKLPTTAERPIAPDM